MQSYYTISIPVMYRGLLPAEIWTRQDLFKPDVGEISGTLSETPIDPAKWGTPPHQCLANLDITLEAQRDFVKTYGPMDWQPADPSSANPRPAFHSLPSEFLAYQRHLRLAWDGDKAALEKVQEWAASAFFARPVFQEGRLELAVEYLRNYIGLLFLRDYTAARIRRCARPDCPHPYFVARRKDQEFCQHYCAVLAGLRKTRETAKQREKSKRRKR